MVKWQIEASLDKDYIFKLAELKGWYDTPPKVQIKKIRGAEEVWWVIEPYEEGCNCPDLVRPPTRSRG
jgi:hypothetical protein